MKTAVVYRSFSAADAHLVRSLLESAEIPAEVIGELASLSMEGYSMATGGIRVVVPAEFEEEARSVIAEQRPPEGD